MHYSSRAGQILFSLCSDMDSEKTPLAVYTAKGVMMWNRWGLHSLLQKVFYAVLLYLRLSVLFSSSRQHLLSAFYCQPLYVYARSKSKISYRHNSRLQKILPQVSRKDPRPDRRICRSTICRRHKSTLALRLPKCIRRLPA